MKLGFWIFTLTAFFIANTYTDGKYLTMLKNGQKYYKMLGIGFAGLSAYLFLRKHPQQSQSLMQNANGLIKYMPIDRNTTDFLSPLLCMKQDNMAIDPMNTPQQRRMLASGKNAGNKRCVSETKKKFVAASQGWKCGDCQNQLSAWFEVDHKTRLDRGGTNHVDNLVALCRECHGKKTAFENL